MDVLFQFSLDGDQDPLQIKAWLNGDEAAISIEGGRTALMLHGEATGSISWPEKWIDLWAPDMIVVCHPAAAKKANPKYADLIIGEWDGPTGSGPTLDRKFMFVGTLDEVQALCDNGQVS